MCNFVLLCCLEGMFVIFILFINTFDHLPPDSPIFVDKLCRGWWEWVGGPKMLRPNDLHSCYGHFYADQGGRQQNSLQLQPSTHQELHNITVLIFLTFFLSSGLGASRSRFVGMFFKKMSKKGFRFCLGLYKCTGRLS